MEVKMRRIYMAVTTDQYELPVAVADTTAELGRMIGKSRNTIESSLSRTRHGEYKRSRYVAVEVEEWSDG